MLCGRAGSVRTARRARACGWVCRAVSRAVRRTPRQSCCCCGRRRRAVRAGGARPGRGGGATAARTPAARVPGGAWGSWRRCGGCVVQCAAGCGALWSAASTAPEPTPPARRRWRATILWTRMPLVRRRCHPLRFSLRFPPLLLPSAPSLLPLHLCCSALPHSLPQPPATSRNLPQPPAASRSLPERTPRRPSSARLPGWRCGGCVVQCAAGCGALSLRSRSRAAPDPACRRWRSCRRRPPGRRRWLPGRGCAPPPAPPPEPPFSSPSAPLLLSPPPQPPATSRNVPQPPGTSRNLPERPATSRNVPHSPAAFLRRPEAVPVEPHPGIRSVCSRQHPLVRTGHKPLRRAIACTSTRRAAPAGAAGVCK
jgi:hypothetical protein